MAQESTDSFACITTGPAESASSGTAAVMGLPPGTPLGEFEVIDKIGEGGFSIVYLAHDHQLQRTVAVKEYLPGAIAYRNAESSVQPRFEKYAATFETGLQSFLKEARILAQFEHHSLIRIHRFWEQNGTAYMVMQYCQGRTLRQVLQSNPGLGSNEVCLNPTSRSGVNLTGAGHRWAFSAIGVMANAVLAIGALLFLSTPSTKESSSGNERVTETIGNDNATSSPQNSSLLDVQPSAEAYQPSVLHDDATEFSATTVNDEEVINPPAPPAVPDSPQARQDSNPRSIPPGAINSGTGAKREMVDATSSFSAKPDITPNTMVSDFKPPITGTDNAHGGKPGAYLRLSIHPWGNVFIEGVDKGMSPPQVRVWLSEGEHSIVIENLGSPNYSTKVKISDKKDAVISYRFLD